MQRFYFENLEDEDEAITLKNSNLLNQLNKVLRAKIWEKFIFFNGKNFIDYIFELKNIEKREAFFVKTWFIEKENFIEKNINLVQSIPNKLEKIEFILQKWVEVWITNFLFFRSERSAKLNLTENKKERLKKIIIEAVEQSGRNDLPEMFFIDDISLEDFKDWENVFFHTNSQKSQKLKDLKLDFSKNINLFVWPEWGFSEDEIKIFEENNFKKIYLWKNILRTETTWVVVWFYLIQN